MKEHVSTNAQNWKILAFNEYGVAGKPGIGPCSETCSALEPKGYIYIRTMTTRTVYRRSLIHVHHNTRPEDSLLTHNRRERQEASQLVYYVTSCWVSSIAQPRSDISVGTHRLIHRFHRGHQDYRLPN